MPIQTRDLEDKIHSLLEQINQERKRAESEGVGQGLLREYGDAEAYAKKCLECLRAGDLSSARILWFEADTSVHFARSSFEIWRELIREIDLRFAQA